MRRIRIRIGAVALAGMVAGFTGPALACGMGYGNHTTATHQQSQRVEELRAKLKANDAAIATTQDQTRLLELLRERAVLQDALLAELMPKAGQRAEGDRGAHQH